MPLIMRRAATRPMIVLVSLLAVTACSEERPRVVARDGVQLLVDTRADGGMDAQLIGRLVVGTGGCLALDGGGGAPKPIIWPKGTQLGPEGKSVLLPDDRTMSVGQEIEHGGGESGAAGSPFTAVPAECLAESDTLAVFSPSG